MTSPLVHRAETATSAGPGPVASFLRFVILGGGVGVLSGLAVPLLATLLPWAVANALVTAASTLLCTELHARFTFGTGRRARWREHWQSAGSATVAYLVTTAAVYVLHLIQPAPGILTEQTVYLSASALAGLGRFAVLRLYVFAVRRGQEPPARSPGQRQRGVVPVRRWAGRAPAPLPSCSQHVLATTQLTLGGHMRSTAPCKAERVDATRHRALAA
jgi:putative flippase GtrA